MAAALRPEPARITAPRWMFVRKPKGARRGGHLVCLVCRSRLTSYATIDEGTGTITCAARAHRDAPPCGAIYWLVAGIRLPWGAGGVLMVRTTADELSRLEAAGYTVEQRFDHFTSIPHPDHR